MRIIPITPLFLLILPCLFWLEHNAIWRHIAVWRWIYALHHQWIVVVLAAIDVAIDIKHRHRNKVSLTFDEVKALLLVITVVLLFVLLLDILGFVICSFCCFYFNENTRCQTFAFRYRFDIGISYYLVHFARVLLVAFPEGILF